jgi:hypothetical protein
MSDLSPKFMTKRNSLVGLLLVIMGSAAAYFYTYSGSDSSKIVEPVMPVAREAAQPQPVVSSQDVPVQARTESASKSDVTQTPAKKAKIKKSIVVSSVQTQNTFLRTVAAPGREPSAVVNAPTGDSAAAQQAPPSRPIEVQIPSAPMAAPPAIAAIPEAEKGSPEKKLPEKNSAEKNAPEKISADKSSADKKSGGHIYGGIGINYVRYQENLSDVVTNYADIRGPSYSVGVSMDLNDNNAIESSYKSTPFRFDNSSVGLSDLSAVWQTLTLQMATQSESASRWIERKLNDEEKTDRFDILYGFQLHQVPLPLFMNGTNQPTLKDIQLFDASLGARWQKYLNPRTRTSLEFRAQYPLASSSSTAGSSFSINPVVLFDGSVGIDKKFITDSLWLGLYWYGQYHDFNFNYNDPTTTASGSQSTFFSNIELRLTFDF